MDVCLIQIDGKLPNLALMRLSAWHKAQGHGVTLLTPADLKGVLVLNTFDKYYAAAVFSDSRPLAEKLHRMGVEVGGTGWDITSRLSPEIEAMKPDYELYDIDYGFGFLNRGCVRSCSFCIVPEKEGRIRPVAMPVDLLNPKSKKLVLLDNNFLASPKWKKQSQEIIDRGIKVDFTQGLDIRLVTDEASQYLAAMKHYKKIHFAFDNVEMADIVMSGIQKLNRAGIKPYRLSFFVLTNYNTTFEQDMKRIDLLISMGVDPFVMVYNRTNAPQNIKNLARWCNRPWIRKSCNFEDYRGGIHG